MGMTNNEIREQLNILLDEAILQHDELSKQNEILQKRVISIKNTELTATENKQSDISMNEHKYLNTLGNVHIVRLKLKDTQEQYNKMAAELQEKL